MNTLVLIVLQYWYSHVLGLLVLLLLLLLLSLVLSLLLLFFFFVLLLSLLLVGLWLSLLFLFLVVLLISIAVVFVSFCFTCFYSGCHSHSCDFKALSIIRMMVIIFWNRRNGTSGNLCVDPLGYIILVLSSYDPYKCQPFWSSLRPFLSSLGPFLSSLGPFLSSLRPWLVSAAGHPQVAAGPLPSFWRPSQRGAL